MSKLSSNIILGAGVGVAVKVGMGVIVGVEVIAGESVMLEFCAFLVAVPEDPARTVSTTEVLIDAASTVGTDVLAVLQP